MISSEELKSVLNYLAENNSLTGFESEDFGVKLFELIDSFPQNVFPEPGKWSMSKKSDLFLFPVEGSGIISIKDTLTNTFYPGFEFAINSAQTIPRFNKYQIVLSDDCDLLKFLEFSKPKRIDYKISWT
jgi:hypothetical protein